MENLHVNKWYMDAYFYIHTDFERETVSVMTLGGGTFQYISCKKNINTWSSTEAELIGSNDTYAMIL